MVIDYVIGDGEVREKVCRMMIREKLPSRRESTLRPQSYRGNNARTKNKRK